MQISAEIRWFWKDTPPPGLEDWFRSARGEWCAAGGGGGRADQYLQDPNGGELGIKRRGGTKGVEVKGLVVAVLGVLATAPFVGAFELWAKWTSEALHLTSGETIEIQKQRWLRKFDAASSPPCEIELDAAERPIAGRRLPSRGCNVELTRLGLPNRDVWWTLGFEAFGTIETVAKDLPAVAAALAARQPPALGAAISASYPLWLRQLQ